mgnify:CR=1 FL=1
MCRARLAGLSGFALACFGFSVFGQDHLVLPEQTLRLPAVRIADNEAPKLDGRLDDPVWQKAFAVDNFTQVHPNEGDEPTERTVLKVLYNERNLFFGIRCHDSEPDKINARHMMRDAAHMGDDSFLILLDGFRNNRNGYIFMLNPLGAMRDGLLNRTRRAHYDSSWDGIWDARCRIDDQGWVIEVSLPFKTLSFDPDQDTWGANFFRIVARKKESIRWNHPVRGDTVYNMKDFGEITGLENLETSRGLELRPYLTLGHSHREGSGNFDEEAGLDLAYRFNPRVSAQLSYNMDFAETEVDSRRINLTRFPIFFPEKRDFFLENRSIFSFGGVQLSPVAFHSRRIGLNEDREPVDIIGAARISGSLDGVQFGLIDAQLDDQPGIGSKNLSVARAMFDVGEESSLGFIATNGEPHSDGDSSLGGLDYSYRNSDFTSADLDFQANFYLMAIEADSLSGNPAAFGSSVTARNDDWYFYGGAEQVQDDFDPALGYVRQDDIHEYDLFLRRRFRPEDSVLPGFGNVDSLDLELEGNVVVSLDDYVDRWVWEPGIELENDAGDEIEFIYFIYRENLTEDFSMSYGEDAGEAVVVPAADYRWGRPGFFFSTSSHRSFSVRLVYTTGDYYEGSREYYYGSLLWKPSPALLSGVYSTHQKIKIGGVAFDTHVAGSTLTLGFSPRLNYLLNVQYDNFSDSVGLNHRIRWIRKPGDEMFLVVNQEADVHHRWTPTVTEAKVKAGWTFSF